MNEKHTAEKDAPVVYGCCQHCIDYDANPGQEVCEEAPHIDVCHQPYCSGSRPVPRVIPPGLTDHA